MEKIQMVDLKRQYTKIKPEIDAAIQKVIDDTAFINGAAVKEFQQNLEQYLGVRHVIPCANGTDALQIAMMALDLKPGDEVIAPNFTFIATVEVVALLGLKLVLVDVEEDTFNMSTDAVESAITPKTKAIVPVHLFGQCCNMEKILNLAQKHNIAVIEDLAQANGAVYTFSDGKKLKAGAMGTLGCTSFFPSKNLGCFGDGGAIMTQDDALASKLRYIANHGMKQRYYYETIGVNSRLDTLQAAILKVKLKYLDEYHAARNKAADYYDNAFRNHPQIVIPTRNPNSSHIFHQYTIRVNPEKRNALKDYLEKNGIPAMIYYPVPLHVQNAYLYLGYKEGDFPVTEKLCKSVISIPMHTELDEEQLQYITRSVLSFFN